MMICKAVCSLGLHTAIPVCICVLKSYRDTGRVGSGPTLMTSLYHSHLCKGPISKYSRIPRSWG